jgi:hypothetical protein
MEDDEEGRTSSCIQSFQSTTHLDYFYLLFSTTLGYMEWTLIRQKASQSCIA